MRTHFSEFSAKTDVATDWRTPQKRKEAFSTEFPAVKSQTLRDGCLQLSITYSNSDGKRKPVSRRVPKFKDEMAVSSAAREIASELQRMYEANHIDSASAGNESQS